MEEEVVWVTEKREHTPTKSKNSLLNGGFVLPLFCHNAYIHLIPFYHFFIFQYNTHTHTHTSWIIITCNIKKFKNRECCDICFNFFNVECLSICSRGRWVQKKNILWLIKRCYVYIAENNEMEVMYSFVREKESKEMVAPMEQRRGTSYWLYRGE